MTQMHQNILKHSIEICIRMSQILGWKFWGFPFSIPEHCLSSCVFICVSSHLSVCFCARGCKVLDVNDETPTFDPRVYNVSLRESVPRDYTVASLACSDDDAGLNAELSYFITGQRSQRSHVFLSAVQ